MREGMVRVPPAGSLVLVVFLVLAVLFSGCISEDTPPPAPIGGTLPQRGVAIQTIGEVTGQGVVLQGVPRGTIDTVTFTLGLVPGAKSVDLTNMTIVYADAVRTEILQPVAGYRGEPPAGYWGITGTLNELGSVNMRLEFEKQFVIRINPKAPIVPNQVITISVKPESGRALVIRRVAPSAIVPDDNILPPV